MPEQKAFGHVLGQALCHVLGLDPELTANLTIEMDPNKFVTVTVVSWPTPGQAEGVTHLVSRYRLVPIEDESQ
jgi:hypothetical protein